MKTLLTIAAIILVMAVVLALLGRFQRGRSRVIAVEQRPAHEGPPSVARERRSAVGSGRASATVEASPEPGPEPGSEPGPEPGPEPGSGSGAARRARGIPKAPRDIRIGDLLLVTGSRSEIEDMPLRVREIHGYQGDNAFWYEFVCEGDRGRVTLEVESL